MLFRAPLFAVGAIATLALGIGANATIFSLASSALLRPLPGVKSPDRLVWLSSSWRDQSRQAGLSYPDYLDYRDDRPMSSRRCWRSTPCRFPH